MRQNRLAQILEMDETALSRIVNGFRKPSAELRVKIAGVLGCDEGWLFEEAIQIHPHGSDAPRSRDTNVDNIDTPEWSGPPRIPETG